MSQIPYYHDDVTAMIECLSQKASTYLGEYQEKETPGSRLGYWLGAGLSETLCFERPYHNMALDHRMAENGVVRFHDDFKRSYPEMPFSAKIRDQASMIDFLEGATQRDHLGTLEILVLCYFLLYHTTETMLPKAALTTVKKLVSKFENFGRIFFVYDKNLRKASERYDEIMLYAMFSLVLLGLYKKTKKVVYFNTALKLNDLLIRTIGIIEGPVLTLASLAALSQGRASIEALYDSEGFRLPVG